MRNDRRKWLKDLEKKNFPSKQICLQCGYTKAIKQFYPRRNGYSSVCRSCTQKNKYRGEKPVPRDPNVAITHKESVSAIERVCKRIFGRSIKNKELTGNESLLLELANFARNTKNMKDKKELMLWFANKMNANPPRESHIKQDVSIDNRVTKDVEDMITNLQVIDGGKK